MAVMMAFLPDRVSADRLRRAVALDAASNAVHQVIYVDSWEAVEDCTAQVLVFDPFESGPHPVEAAARFQDRFPSVALVPYGRFRGRTHRELILLMPLGVPAVVTRDEDDHASAFRGTLESALTRTVVGKVVGELGAVVPAHLVPLLRRMISSAHTRLDPGDVAKLSHRHPNTLREHLREAGLPSVNKLIVWCRLFQAGNLLGDDQRSVENVAFTLDFPSASALRNQLLRYTGMTPLQIRAAGGLVPLFSQFRERHRTGCWELGPSSTFSAT
jgi:AraC-like DNA-binding protein